MRLAQVLELDMNQTSVCKMGKHKNATKAGRGAQRDSSPSLLF